MASEHRESLAKAQRRQDAEIEAAVTYGPQQASKLDELDIANVITYVIISYASDACFLYLLRRLRS